MTPDELVALADALGEDPWYLPISKGQGEIRTLNEDEINFIAAMSPSLARDHAALLKQRDEDRAWMKRAADVLRAMLSTLADYPTVEEMNETRFADLRGYMVDAETDLLATLLAEWDAMKERP